MRGRWIHTVAGMQGVYYCLVGLWPVFHPASFQAIMGPTPDLGLQRTMGAFLALMGAALLGAAVRKRLTREWLFLALSTALLWIAVDLMKAWSNAAASACLLNASVLAIFGVVWIMARIVSRRRAASQHVRTHKAFAYHLLLARGHRAGSRGHAADSVPR